MRWDSQCFCKGMVFYAMLCFAMVFYAMLCYAVLCFANHTVLRYAILCCAMLFSDWGKECFAVKILHACVYRICKVVDTKTKRKKRRREEDTVTSSRPGYSDALPAMLGHAILFSYQHGQECLVGRALHECRWRCCTVWG